MAVDKTLQFVGLYGYTMGFTMFHILIGVWSCGRSSKKYAAVDMLCLLCVQRYAAVNCVHMRCNILVMSICQFIAYLFICTFAVCLFQIVSP